MFSSSLSKGITIFINFYQLEVKLDTSLQMSFVGAVYMVGDDDAEVFLSIEDNDQPLEDKKPSVFQI